MAYGVPEQQQTDAMRLARLLAEQRKNADKAAAEQKARAAQAASSFATQGQVGYEAGTRELAQDRQSLRDLQSGKNSVSAEQLRQGLQQNLASQRSMAASASPNNSAMAARTAAIQGGRASYGMAGQQAVAGLAERNQATQNLSQMNLGQRGQDANVALGSRQNELSALEDKKSETASAQQKGMMITGMLAQAMSDERAKNNIQSGDVAARRAMDTLSAKSFTYKNPQAHGKGQQLGVVAQDLEKVVPGAVVNTREGKMVDGAKLSTANTAMIAEMAARLAKVEKDKKRGSNSGSVSNTPLVGQ